jgi:hypothetical protein
MVLLYALAVKGSCQEIEDISPITVKGLIQNAKSVAVEILENGIGRSLLKPKMVIDIVMGVIRS